VVAALVWEKAEIAVKQKNAVRKQKYRCLLKVWLDYSRDSATINQI
jgi:hypothetical protein